jgi:signal peptidase II
MAAAPSSDWRGRWLWLTLAIIAADRAVKYAVERYTSEGFRRDLVPNIVILVHNVNSGIAFGLLSESTSGWISTLLIGSSAAVIVLLVWLLLAGRAGDTWCQAGLALIAGGAAGNLLDRLLHGGVTDFLELHAGSFAWPAFNLADSAITMGAFLVILDLLHGGQHASRERV